MDVIKTTMGGSNSSSSWSVDAAVSIFKYVILLFNDTVQKRIFETSKNVGRCLSKT